MAKKQTRGERVIAFVERYCIVPDGSLVGKPMRLLPFQKRFIVRVYDNPHGTRRAYLSIARKNGKTGLIAALVLAHLVGPEAAHARAIKPRWCSIWHRRWFCFRRNCRSWCGLCPAASDLSGWQ
jgi:hypothetical protein